MRSHSKLTPLAAEVGSERARAEGGPHERRRQRKEAGAEVTTAAHTLNRATFKTSRLLEFCSEKELGMQTGHPRDEWPAYILKELIDNALDACEEAGVPPEITVTVDDDGIAVTDNGPGIPEATIRGVIDYAVRVSSREAYVSPTRGAQGNALKTIIPMPYVLDGDVGRVVVRVRGAVYAIQFEVDHINQRPAVSVDEVVFDGPDGESRGTSVAVQWPNLASSILTDAKAQFLQIADDYTWLNPHLTLTVEWFGASTVVKRTAADWVKWLPSNPTCPHWYTPERFERLVAAYVSNGSAARTVRDFVSEFRGLKGSQKQKVVCTEANLLRSHLLDLTTGNNLDRPTIGTLLDAMQGATRPVQPKALGVIGEDHLRQRLEAAGCDMDSFSYRKVVDVLDGVPRVIETAFGYCPGREEEPDPRRLVTAVNWSAAIKSPFRQLGPWGKSLDTVLSEFKIEDEEPVIFVLHLACPQVQYTDRGKSAVVIQLRSDSDAILGAVKSVTKKWTKQKKAEERRARARVNRRYMWTSRNTLKDVAWEFMPQAYNKASANGRLPAHARQIYYAARPLVEEETDRSLQDSYFTQTLLPEYIYEHGLTWNVVYDDRGHLIEPNHGGDDRPIAIGLGTLGVRKYLKSKGPPTLSTAETKMAQLTSHGPNCRYRAVLFVEKEGFMPLFEEVKLAERYDIAIMSTKGMSNTASRELVEHLGVPIYVLHDFDQSGFSILGTLRRSTKRYQFAETPNVIDLGIRLEDIKQYNLAYEAYRPRGGGSQFNQNLRINGAKPEEIKILLNSRVELNAFASDELIEWIEAKFAEHGVTKVIPGDEWLTEMYQSTTASAHLEAHATEIIEEANKYGEDVPIPESLRDQVVERLREEPRLSWDQAVIEIATADFEDEAA